MPSNKERAKRADLVASMFGLQGNQEHIARAAPGPSSMPDKSQRTLAFKALTPESKIAKEEKEQEENLHRCG